MRALDAENRVGRERARTKKRCGLRWVGAEGVGEEVRMGVGVGECLESKHYYQSSISSVARVMVL